MSTNIPDDYIIATGKTTKLDNVVKKIFSHYKLKKNKYLIKSRSLSRALEPLKINADIKKLRKKIKIIPKISIDKIISMMITEEKK